MLKKISNAPIVREHLIKEAFERIIQSDNYDLQMLLVQMNDHKSVK